MDLDDECIEREGREIDNMIKRHREHKGKKQEGEIERTQKPPQHAKQTMKQTVQTEMGAIAKAQGES